MLGGCQAKHGYGRTVISPSPLMGKCYPIYHEFWSHKLVGRTIYGFVDNDPVDNLDYLGMLEIENDVTAVQQVRPSLQVTCPSSGKVVGTVSVSVALDASKQKNINVALASGLPKNFLGVYIKLVFTITDQAALNKCCSCAADPGADAGWVQLTGGGYDDKVYDWLTHQWVKKYKDPWYAGRASEPLEDLPGSQDFESLSFQDELHCTNLKAGATDNTSKDSYQILNISNASQYNWSFTTSKINLPAPPRTYRGPPQWPPPPTSKIRTEMTYD